MRILNLIASMDPSHGGPIEGAMRLAETWRNMGHTAELVTLDDPQAEYLDRTTVPVTALGRFGAGSRSGVPTSFLERYGYSPTLVPWLRAHLHEYDVVLVHALWNYTSLAARRVIVRSGTPYFVFPHGTLSPWFRKAQPKKHLLKSLLWPVSEGVLMNNATAVLYTTENERDQAEGAYRPYRVKAEVVGFGSGDPPRNPADQVAAFEKALPQASGREFLLFLGRLDPIKGCDLLIEAFGKIAGQYPLLDLVLAGPDHVGWRADLEELAADRGISHRVHWTGMIHGKEKWGAFRRCKAFILPSHSENFGVVVAEALSCGRPVLTTDKVSVAPQVSRCDAGFVETDTQEGVDRLLERFQQLTDAQRATLAHNARRCFETSFRSEDAAARILNLFQRGISRVGS